MLKWMVYVVSHLPATLLAHFCDRQKDLIKSDSYAFSRFLDSYLSTIMPSIHVFVVRPSAHNF